MTKSLDVVTKKRATRMGVLSENYDHVHWIWWVLAFLLFWPAFLVIIVVGFSRKKYFVSLHEDDKVIYRGYINQNDYLELSHLRDPARSMCK